MKDQNEEFYSVNDLVYTIKSFLGFLRSKLLMLIITIAIGAGIGVLYYFNQKPKYEAVCSFILEEKSSMGGGLSGLASQFGLNLGSLGSGGSIFSGDNIFNILTSKKIVEKVLLGAYKNAGNSKVTLADHYLDFTGTKERWKDDPNLSNINFGKAKATLSPLEDSVLNVIYEEITEKNISAEKTSKQGTIIKVTVTSTDRDFARIMTEQLVTEASELFMTVRVGTSLDNIRQLERRSDSLLVLLNNKSYRAAASQPLDINPAMRSAIVPSEIANRDKTVIATLYAEVTKNLEISRVLLSQQTPVIQVLDQPGELLPDNRKGMAILVIIFSIVASMLFVGAALIYFVVSGKASPGVKSLNSIQS